MYDLKIDISCNWIYDEIVMIEYRICQHSYIVPPPARICHEFSGRDTTRTSLGGCKLDEGRRDQELEVP